MITFFTTAKSFRGHEEIIQRNALQSWKHLHPDVEVILFGDDEGAAEVCAELGLRHEPYVERHESCMKYLNYMFVRAQQIARHKYLCYSNCDIVLMQDFWRAFERTLAWRQRFFLVGQRWDTDVAEPLDFSQVGWAESLQRFAKREGFHQHTDFADFFVFPKGLYDKVPPLVVGRSAWDAWLIWKAISERVPVVDCSSFVVPVHQNHDYRYHAAGKQGTHTDALAIRNRELSGGGRHLRTIIDSTYRFTKRGNIRWAPLRRYIPRLPVRKYWQSFLVRSVSWRARLGLQKQTLDRLRSGKNGPAD